MISDNDLAILCADSYQVPVATWDYFDPGYDDGVCWALKQIDGYDIVVLRGSVVFEDWIRDFHAIAARTPLGIVHSGFYAGMVHMWADLAPRLKQPVIVTGHSLGAARAAILCGLMTVAGVKPVARVVFGEPKPGFVDLANAIVGTPGRSYRNGGARHHDLVTDVPFSFPPLQYVHPTSVISVSAEPSSEGFSALGVFAYHHVQLYVKATPSTSVL